MSRQCFHLVSELAASALPHTNVLISNYFSSGLPVQHTTMPLEDTKDLVGLRAMFGESYPAEVRVVVAGDCSIQQVCDTSLAF